MYIFLVFCFRATRFCYKLERIEVYSQKNNKKSNKEIFKSSSLRIPTTQEDNQLLPLLPLKSGICRNITQSFAFFVFVDRLGYAHKLAHTEQEGYTVFIFHLEPL